MYYLLCYLLSFYCVFTPLCYCRCVSSVLRGNRELCEQLCSVSSEGGSPKLLAGQAAGVLSGKAARLQSEHARVGIRPFLSLAYWPTKQLLAAMGQTRVLLASL